MMFRIHWPTNYHSILLDCYHRFGVGEMKDFRLDFRRLCCGRR